MGNKRRRIALSCVDCRRRKVKCDRTYPSCLRCQKGGQADACAYVPYEGAEPEVPKSAEGDSRTIREQSALSWIEEVDNYVAAGVGAKTARDPSLTATQSKKSTEKSELIRRLEQKVVDLEARIEAAHSREATRANLYTQKVLGLGIPTPASTIHENPASSAAAVELEQILLRGKSFKTQYYGLTNYGSILMHFGELSLFLKDIMARMPSISRYKSVTEAPHKMQRSLETAIQAEASHEHSVLVGLIPNRETTDRLVDHYLGNFEYTYRVLHVPSFFRDYEMFWQNPQQSTTGFLVTLLLVTACVYCIYPEEPASFIGRSSRRRETAIKWIAAADSWMGAQSHKHITITIKQVQILVFLAKRANCVKVKRAWTSAGSLLRLAMASGLHREPAFLSSRISTFHQEMRRRLWATVLELETLTAVDRGMPGTICSLDWDCQPPSNIHDEEFDENTQQLPPSRPYHEFTRTSFLCIALQSIGCRLDMLSAINRVKSTITPDLATQYDVMVRQAYANIPSWSFNSTAQLPRTLARLNLLEFINLIHQHFVTSIDDPARHFFSRAASRDAAATILELYHNISSTDQLILPFLRSDGFRAALLLCYDLSSSSHEGSITSFDRHRATELIELALQMQQNRVMQLGQGFHTFWITSSALGLAYAKQAPGEDPGKYAQLAADRVQKVNERILTLQEPGMDDHVVGGDLLTEARPVLAKGDAIPGKGDGEANATEQLVVGMEPFVDTQVDFDMFNFAEAWDLASFEDFWCV